MFLLNGWCAQVYEAFGEPPYLVGSVARDEDWRDVDLRLMLDVDRFDALTGGDNQRLTALNVALSIWARQATGLPVDFQFQDVDAANEAHDGPRIPLGLSRVIS